MAKPRIWRPSSPEGLYFSSNGEKQFVRLFSARASEPTKPNLSSFNGA